MGRPRTKYMIVTNDTLELPVKIDIQGIVSLSVELNMNENTVRRCLRTEKWSHLRKVKAIRQDERQGWKNKERNRQGND